MDVGDYFYQTQEYVAWCLRDADGNRSRPLKTFDAPLDENGLMEPIVADGEVVNPQDDQYWNVHSGVMDGEPQVIVEDQDQVVEEEDELEAMDLDEDEEVAELDSDEEIYLDPELEPNSEDERAIA